MPVYFVYAHGDPNPYPVAEATNLKDAKALCRQVAAEAPGQAATVINSQTSEAVYQYQTRRKPIDE